MSKHWKTWSPEEKERKVLYSIQNGVTASSREFGVSTVSIYKSRMTLESLGKKGFERGGNISEVERELRELRRENEALKG